MNAADARKTSGVLAALAAADSLAPFTIDNVLFTARHLTRITAVREKYASFCRELGRDLLGELSRAVSSGWRLWCASSALPSQDGADKGATSNITELSGALAKTLRHHRRWPGGSGSHSQQQALESLATAGVLAALPTIAGKLAAALNSHNSLSAEQRQQDLQTAMQCYKLSGAVMNVWCAISKASNPMEVLSTDNLAATLQPVSALALTVICCNQSWTVAGVAVTESQSAVVGALDVAYKLSEAIDILAEQSHKFAAASCLEQLLSTAEFQQLLFVYIGSLTARLYQHRKGQHRVNVTGAAEPAMQLDVPAWHEQVLKELGADWAGQVLPESVIEEIVTAQRCFHDSTVAYSNQLGRALCAADHALSESGCTMSPEQQERMLLPLLRMLVEISALLPHISVSQYCIYISMILISNKGPGRTAKQIIPCGGTSDKESSNASVTHILPREMPTTTAAGILGPVLNLLVPSVLHVLALDSQAALKQYQELYAYGNAELLHVARLSLIKDISAYLTMLLLPFEPMHLVSPILHKPLTSLSILEAAIRSQAAEAIAPSSRNSGLGQFSQFALQQGVIWGLADQTKALGLAMKVTAALKIAATQGKLASTIASPPAGVEQQRWAGMLSGQLSGLLVTCLKVAQVVETKEWLQDSELGIVGAEVLSDVLSVSTQAAKVLSSTAAKSMQVAAPGPVVTTSDSAGGLSANSDVTKLWAAVAGRALALLGQLLSLSAAAAAATVLPEGRYAEEPRNACDGLSQQQQQHLLRILLPHLEPGSHLVEGAVNAVEWVTDSVRTGSIQVPRSVQDQLLQQGEQLCSGLAVADILAQQALASLASAAWARGQLTESTGSELPIGDLLAQAAMIPGSTVDCTPAEHQQVCQLPQLLTMFGSTVCAWIPQQQWCSNVQCQNLGMLRENAIVAGQGKVCAGCSSVRYCSRECQVQDWRNQHKQACKVPKAA